MKTKLFFYILLFNCIANAQVTLFSEDIGSGTTTQTIGATTFQNNATFTFTGTADTRTTTPSMIYTGASGGKNVFFTNVAPLPTFEMSGINTSSYTNLQLSFGHHKSTIAANNQLIVEVSSNGTTYTPLTYSRPTGTGTISWILVTPTGTIPSTSNLRIRFRQTSTAAQFRIDDIQLIGDLNCPTTTNTITPISGPAGTEVMVTSTANILTGATASFNGVSAITIPISATTMKVIVPAGAESGNLVTTTPSGCQANNSFTVIGDVASSCLGGGTPSSSIFISEFTDSTTGSLTYVELYNPTAISVNLGNYSLRTYSNGSTTTVATLNLNSFSLAPNSVYVVAFGVAATPTSSNSCLTTNGNGQLANQTTGLGGINFVLNQNDFVGLYLNSTNTLIDSFGVFGSNNWADPLNIGDRGATFRRKNNVIVPNATYSNSDWNIIDWFGQGQSSCPTNDYSDIGVYNYLVGNPPSVNSQPVFVPSCSLTMFSVSADEGFIDAVGLNYQWYAIAPNTASPWVALANNALYSGVNLPTLTISNNSTLDGYQYYCEIREGSASCATATNAVKIIRQTTWNGVSWSESEPSLNKIAIIDGDYTTNNTTMPSFSACSVIVNSNRTLTISPNTFIEIENDLIVNVSANLLIQNQGSLVMRNDLGTVTNNGTTDIVKTSTPYVQYDYTFWSSPIVGETIGSVFAANPISRRYSFDTSKFLDLYNYKTVIGDTGFPQLQGVPDSFDDSGDDWILEDGTNIVTPGKGYSVMGPTAAGPTGQSVVFNASGVAGQLNNGLVNVNVSQDLYNATSMNVSPAANAAHTNNNLIGNPYASSIDLVELKADNPILTGTFYFWTHKTPVSSSNPGPWLYNFSNDDYVTYTVGTGGSASSCSGCPIPDRYVDSCQGFYANVTGNGTVTFNNSQRVTGNNNAFYRNASNNNDKIWLNFNASTGEFRQILVGFLDNAEDDYNPYYDGARLENGNNFDFFSFIPTNPDMRLAVQGLNSFNSGKIVPLGVEITQGGTHSISINTAEGVFENGQSIYLQDNLTNTTHDFENGSYFFESEISSAINNRFILKFTNNSLGNENFDYTNSISVYSKDKQQVTINSLIDNITEVTLFDILGREIVSKKNSKDYEITFTNLSISNQIVIVKIKLENGSIITRKIRM
jgi:hypothetical protein